jgi:hypothetical protein
MSFSADRMLTCSNHQGDTIYDSHITKQDISNVRWNPFGNPNDVYTNYLACIVGSKVFLYNPTN